MDLVDKEFIIKIVNIIREIREIIEKYVIGSFKELIGDIRYEYIIFEGKILLDGFNNWVVEWI